MPSNPKTVTHVSGSRSQPFLIRLFQAIIAFKRMVARRRKWEVKKKQRNARQKSTLLGEIQCSQKAVKYASFGRTVVDMDEAEMVKYRVEEVRRIDRERAKKLELLELAKKRRGGLKSYDPSAGDPYNVAAYSKISNDPYAFSVADKIKAFRSRIGEELAKKAEIRKRALNRVSMVKDSTAKDVANIIQKNVHISKHDKKTGRQRQ